MNIFNNIWYISNKVIKVEKRGKYGIIAIIKSFPLIKMMIVFFFGWKNANEKSICQKIIIFEGILEILEIRIK